MSNHVISEIADGVQTIRFDRLEAHNALTAEMCEATADAIAFGESSSRVRAILITGGPGIFTSGHDPAEITTFADEGLIGETAIRMMKVLATVDKPVVASVDGLVFGIGATMLFLCDYVIASEWSSFAAPFAELGLPPDAGSSLIAPQIIGYHRAFALMALGEHFDAMQAREAGLVNRVVPAEELDAVARAVVTSLAARPPEAVRLARRLLRGDSRALLARIDQEAASLADLLRSPAARDALQAWLDGKRF